MHCDEHDASWVVIRALKAIEWDWHNLISHNIIKFNITNYITNILISSTKQL